MKLTQNLLLISFFILPLPVLSENADSVLTFSEKAEEIVDIGRNLFYASVEDKSKLDSAFNNFERLHKDYPSYQGRATTYIGALTALKGRHSFWIYTKYKLVKDGLNIMDKGIEQSPNDMEALFVYGSTCYFMPFMFGRKDEAQMAFKRIVSILPEAMHDYDQELVGNVIDFLLEHTELSEEEHVMFTSLKTKLGKK